MSLVFNAICKVGGGRARTCREAACVAMSSSYPDAAHPCNTIPRDHVLVVLLEPPPTQRHFIGVVAERVAGDCGMVQTGVGISRP